MPLPLALRPPVLNSARLRDAILSLQPTAYWPLDDGNGPLRDIAGNWSAAVTGTPLYRQAAPQPIGRGVTWSGTGQYAVSSGSVPTPAASVSVLVFLNTTNATASVRTPAARRFSNQNSWWLRLNSDHSVGFFAMQADGTNHCTATVAGAVNDGLWHIVTGTFDGTTLRVMRDAATPATSTSLTGSWHTASTAGIGIAQNTTSNLFPGTLAHLALFTDRVVTHTEHLWLRTIAAGG